MPHVLTLKQKKQKAGSIYYPLQLTLVPKPTPGPGQILVKIQAASLNHRDVFIRQDLYPLISFQAPLLSDGCGVVVEEGPDCKSNLLDKTVVLAPGRGWDENPEGPDDFYKFSTIGGAKPYEDQGCAQTYAVVEERYVDICPAHLSPVECSSLPAAGITAWRSLVSKSANAQPGRNILITGIGGGVALFALQFAVAIGCNVWVTSSSPAKIAKAVEMGAKGGVSYKDDNWSKALEKMLPADRPFLDCVLDGAGGDIVLRTMPVLKCGGVIVSYGMTLGPVMDWPMLAVLKNIDLKGATLGSRLEFADMVKFVADKQIKPVISRTVKGLDCLEEIESLFDDMKQGKQFGKLAIEF